MTLLIGSLFVDDAADLARRCDVAFTAGADAVELRLDAYEGDPATIAKLITSREERTWIVTCRSAAQGGLFRGDTMQRVSLLLAAARGTGAYVDFEWDDWQRSANIRQKVLLACTPPDERPRLILSHHDHAGLPADAQGLLAAMRSEPAARVVKLAFRTAHPHEALQALDLLREFGKSAMVMAMGEEGFFSRVLARKFGAWGSYAALDSDGTTAPGQCSVATMTSLYRWSQVSSTTRFYGVIGDPVAHSLSPLLHNDWFARYGVDAVYVPLLVPRGAEELERFLDACTARPWLDVGGFSVTAPHKEALVRWAGERADRLSQSLGAANTFVGSSTGISVYNTDAYAAVDALCARLGTDQRGLYGLTVDILGAGGTGRAISVTLGGLGCRVAVYDRKPDRAGQIARQAGGTAHAWDKAAQGIGSILINTTPPASGSLSDDILAGVSRRLLVFDVNYNPARTELIIAAEQAGVAAMNGVEMFVRQAGAQFALWTGIEPDLAFGRQLVMDASAQRKSES